MFSIDVKGAAGCDMEVRSDDDGVVIELAPDVVWTPGDLRRMAAALEAAARMIEPKRG
jgi:GT2 family glycosyltransferase